MTTSNEHNNAPAVPSGLLQKLDASIAWLERGEVLPGTPACIGLDDIKVIRALLAATPAPAPAQGEPFGHFRVEPFGWTDCAKDDEGAIALYERPQEVGLTDEDRQQVFRAAENRMVHEINLSWRNAVVDEVIAALRAKGGKHV